MGRRSEVIGPTTGAEQTKLEVKPIAEQSDTPVRERGPATVPRVHSAVPLAAQSMSL
jgi:hypothetical protein